jgi:hypothetical protein
MQCKIDIAVMIGSGVPESLRQQGRKACWVVLVDGEQRGTAFATRREADECRSAWRILFGILESIGEGARPTGLPDEGGVEAAR